MHFYIFVSEMFPSQIIIGISFIIFVQLEDTLHLSGCLGVFYGRFFSSYANNESVVDKQDCILHQGAKNPRNVSNHRRRSYATCFFLSYLSNIQPITGIELGRVNRQALPNTGAAFISCSSIQLLQ